MCTLFYYLIPVILISVQDNGAMEVLLRMNYLNQKVFSKRCTFLCYRASQSRCSTRRPPFTTRASSNMHQTKRHTHSNFRLNSMCYLISYTRLFTKLNLLETLLYVTYIAMKLPRSIVNVYTKTYVQFY